MNNVWWDTIHSDGGKRKVEYGQLVFASYHQIIIRLFLGSRLDLCSQANISSNWIRDTPP